MCTIYDQVPCMQPLTAESILNVDTTLHDEINAAASETVEVIETVARASFVTDIVGTVATIVEVAGGKAASVEGTAQAVGDIAKCVSIVGGVFQAVAISARCVRMVSEASRGRASFPRLHSELVALPTYTSERAMIVVDAETSIDEICLDHMFNVQEDFVLTLGNIEEHLMRRWVMQAWRGDVVADTEAKVAGLRERVVVALNTRGIALNTRDIASLT